MSPFHSLMLAFTLVVAVSTTCIAQTTTPAAQGAKPSVYRDSFSVAIRSLDPATCEDTASSSLQANIYEGLYTYHYLKRPLEVIPQLADGMPEVSKDGLTWTIKLKKGVKYHRNACFGMEADGKTPKTREMEAEDFVLAFKRIADVHIQSSMALAMIDGRIEGLADYQAKTKDYASDNLSRYREESISGIKAVDAHTLQIKLTKPFPQLQYMLAMTNYAPIPREVVDYWIAGKRQGTRPDRNGDMIRTIFISDPRAVVGTGPYILSKFKDKEVIVLDRNPDFRDDRYPADGAPGDKEAGLLADAGKRVPFSDRVIMEYQPESEPAWEVFMKGELATSGIPAAHWNDVVTKDHKLKDEYAKKGLRLVTWTMPAVYFVAINMNDPILGKSKSLRHAISLAMDRQKLIEDFYNGRGVPLKTIVPEGLDGVKEAAASPYADYDVTKAKKLVQAAKEELKKAGVLKEGEDLPTMTTLYPDMSQIAQRRGKAVIACLAAIGLNVEYKYLDWPAFMAQQHKGDWQMADGSGWHADYPDPENFLQMFYSPNIAIGANTTNYSNKDYDDPYEKMSVMAPGKERTAIIVKMIQMIHEDCPVILQTAPQSSILVQPWVHNFKPHPVGYGYMKYRRVDPQPSTSQADSR